MKKMQAAIDSGEANSEKCVTGFMRELFYILFGADGCAALLAWCGNDYNAAMEAIEPYYSKIHSKLQRIVDKGGYK